MGPPPPILSEWLDSRPLRVPPSTMNIPTPEEFASYVVVEKIIEFRDVADWLLKVKRTYTIRAARLVMQHCAGTQWAIEIQPKDYAKVVGLCKLLIELSDGTAGE
jgi:hypothetical protein